MKLLSSVASARRSCSATLAAGAAAWLVAGLLVAGCGQKGPLTLPTSAAAKPAPAATAPASSPQGVK